MVTNQFVTNLLLPIIHFVTTHNPIRGNSQWGCRKVLQTGLYSLKNKERQSKREFNYSLFYY